MSKNVFVMAAEEKQPFDDVLENLSPADHKVVDAIAARVNQRVIATVGAPPKVPFYKSWGPLLVGALLVTSVVTFLVWPSDTETNLADNAPAASTLEQPPSDAATPVVTPETDEEEPNVLPSENNVAPADENRVQPTSTEPDQPLTFDGRQSVDEAGTPTELEGNPNPELETELESPTAGSGPDQPLENVEVTENTEPQDNLGQTPPDDNPPSNYVATVYVKVIDKRTYLGVKPPNDGGVVRNGELPSRDGGTNRNAVMLPQEMPSYPGGDRALEEFLANQIDESLRRNPDLQGETVAVNFLVSHKGKVSDIHARNGNTAMQAEAERIVALMPYWDQGSKKGKISCMVTISFK